MGNCIQRDIVGESGEHIIRSRSKRRSNALSNDTEDTISDIDNNIDYIDIDDDDDNDDDDDDDDDDNNNNNSSSNSNSNKKRNIFGWTRNSNKFFSNFQTSNSSTSSLSSSSSSSSFSSSHHRNDNQQQSSSTTLSTSPSHSSRKTSGIVHNYISNHSEEMIKHSLLYSDESIDRLHLMHYILKYIWGKNYISPIEGLLRRGGACVLEIGCGSGTWSLEMGCEYPLTRFYGVELTSIFPTNIKPQNVRFLPINVAENGLPFENDKFDFVYINSLNIVLSEQEWSRVFIEIARVLKPGGLFECMNELKFFDDQGPKTKRIHLACIDTFSKLGISTPMFKSSKLQRSLENIYQFTNIEAIQKITSIIDWEDNVSDLIKECMMKFMETVKFMILPQLRVSNEEYDLLVKEMLEVEIKEYNSTFASCRLCCKKIVSLDNNIDDY